MNKKHPLWHISFQDGQLIGRRHLEWERDAIYSTLMYSLDGLLADGCFGLIAVSASSRPDMAAIASLVLGPGTGEKLILQKCYAVTPSGGLIWVDSNSYQQLPSVQIPRKTYQQGDRLELFVDCDISNREIVLQGSNASTEQILVRFATGSLDSESITEIEPVVSEEHTTFLMPKIELSFNRIAGEGSFKLAEIEIVDPQALRWQIPSDFVPPTVDLAAWPDFWRMISLRSLNERLSGLLTNCGGALRGQNSGEKLAASEEMFLAQLLSSVAYFATILPKTNEHCSPKTIFKSLQAHFGVWVSLAEALLSPKINSHGSAATILANMRGLATQIYNHSELGVFFTKANEISTKFADLITELLKVIPVTLPSTIIFKQKLLSRLGAEDFSSRSESSGRYFTLRVELIRGQSQIPLLLALPLEGGQAKRPQNALLQDNLNAFDPVWALPAQFDPSITLPLNYVAVAIEILPRGGFILAVPVEEYKMTRFDSQLLGLYAP